MFEDSISQGLVVHETNGALSRALKNGHCASAYCIGFGVIFQKQ
jgi:hypothetical protein